MNINKHIEHTLLKPNATRQEIVQLCKEAKDNSFHGVCVNPHYVGLAKEQLSGTSVKVVTVIGFPLGSTPSAVKAFEASQAVKDGADELDMVINIGALKDGQDEFVRQDVAEVVKASQQKTVKVILETDALVPAEIKRACLLCADAGANFVKTSTGFFAGGVGATVENVRLMHETVKNLGLQVKASGGVRSTEDAQKMLDAGATRLGTSSGVKIVQGLKSDSLY